MGVLLRVRTAVNFQSVKTSALGQSRQGGASCRSSHVRNAPLATVDPNKAACRNGPIGDIAVFLFDHLVSPREEGFGDRQPKCLRRLEIDDEVEFGRLLDRQIAGLRPA